MNLSIFFSPKPSIVKHWKPLGLGYKPHQLPLQIEGVWVLAWAAPRRKAEAVRSLGVPVGGGAAVVERGSAILCRTTRTVQSVQNGGSPQRSPRRQDHLYSRGFCTTVLPAPRFGRNSLHPDVRLHRKTELGIMGTIKQMVAFALEWYCTVNPVAHLSDL